jgi:hypothetical protein
LQPNKNSKFESVLEIITKQKYKLAGNDVIAVCPFLANQSYKSIRSCLAYELFCGNLSELEFRKTEENLRNYIEVGSNTKPHLKQYFESRR